MHVSADASRFMDELIRELKAEGVLTSPLVAQAFRAIDRKDFVLPEYEDQAYANYPLAIGSGQTISQPYTVAFMLDLLDPRPGEKILDIGSGSGWTTALLAHVVSRAVHHRTRIKNRGRVWAVERIPELCQFGQANVRKYDFIKSGVVRFATGDGNRGLGDEAPFDKILASAAAGGEIPTAWREQLSVGGRIVAPVRGSVWRYIKAADAEWKEEEFPGFAFVPLVGNSEWRTTNSE